MDSFWEAILRKDFAAVAKFIVPYIEKIAQEKALYADFVTNRILTFFYIKKRISDKSENVVLAGFKPE